MKTTLAKHLNLNTLLLVILGFLARHYLSSIEHSMEAVVQNTTDIAVIKSQVVDLKQNCVTEARLNDIVNKVAHVKTPKQQIE